MLISSEIMKRRRRKPEFVIASFSLTRHPRYKGGSRSSGNYIGFSKPIIQISRFESFYIDECVKFGNDIVRVIDWMKDSIALQFEKGYCGPNEGKIEIRTVCPNKPISTGFNPDLYDLSCECFFCCWTSPKKFLQYLFEVKWERWVDDSRAQIIGLPSYFSARAIRWRWNYWRNRLNGVVDELLHLDRPVRWR